MQSSGCPWTNFVQPPSSEKAANSPGTACPIHALSSATIGQLDSRICHLTWCHPFRAGLWKIAKRPPSPPASGERPTVQQLLLGGSVQGDDLPRSRRYTCRSWAEARDPFRSTTVSSGVSQSHPSRAGTGPAGARQSRCLPSANRPGVWARVAAPQRSSRRRPGVPRDNPQRTA